MRVTFIREWTLSGQGPDATQRVVVGEQILEEIPNPYYADALPWFVLKGTRTGMAMDGWRNLRDNGVVDFTEVRVQSTTPLEAPAPPP